MPKLADQVRVKVTDKGADGSKRRLLLELEIESGMLYLTDALSKEGLVQELPQELRQVVRKGVLSYVENTRARLRDLGGGAAHRRGPRPASAADKRETS